MARRYLSALVMAAMMATGTPIMGPGALAETQQATPANIDLYKQFLKLDGTGQNLGTTVANYKTETRNAIADMVHQTEFLTPEQEARFDAIATPIFDEVQGQILDDIARAQAAAFTTAEINTLIALNTRPATQKYKELIYSQPADLADRMQNLMVDAVVDIIKTFKGDMPRAEMPVPGTAPVDRLMQVDGTAALTRDIVSKEHMALIIQEVGNYIDFNALNDADRQTLAEIAAVESERLADNILKLNARRYAAGLTEAEINELIAAYDTPAQMKLVEVRIADDGSVDAKAGQRLNNAIDRVHAAYIQP